MIEALAREVDDWPLREFFERTSVIQHDHTKSELIGANAVGVKAETPRPRRRPFSITGIRRSAFEILGARSSRIRLVRDARGG